MLERSVYSEVEKMVLTYIIWNMHHFLWFGVKQESDCLHHGSGGVGLDADSKFTKQDRTRSQKKQSPRTSAG